MQNTPSSETTKLDVLDRPSKERLNDRTTRQLKRLARVAHVHLLRLQVVFLEEQVVYREIAYKEAARAARKTITKFKNLIDEDPAILAAQKASRDWKAAKKALEEKKKEVLKKGSLTTTPSVFGNIIPVSFELKKRFIEARKVHPDRVLD